MNVRATLIALIVMTPYISGAAPVGDFVPSERTRDGIQFVRKVLPARNIAAGTLAQSKVIYLNRTGITLSPGDDDARTNRSSIISGQRSVPAWNTSAANWAATVACMKDMFAPFDVTVTDVDPGNVPHMEAVFGGSPGNIGMGQGVGGVSPFTTDCAVIENSIVFTFTNVLPQGAQAICEIMAQEVAHSYGLDHEMLASDPMTYLSFNGARSFKDQTVPCGEYQNRACGIGGSTCRANQNSVKLLTERLGRADLVAPTLDISSPADGETVAPGFEVAATAMDNVAVTGARLFVDDVDLGAVTGPGPYMFPTDPSLADGAHVLKVEVTDGKHPVTRTITVNVARGGGSGGGDGDGGEDGASPEDDGAITGGCSTGGSGAGLWLALWLGLAVARRGVRRL
ncbi:MAG: Ig-like domain-containing protein [Deltaproteobacteria bacterium]|nr:Ig-like domain-containing protein [Deltaproteobacteria bacterium]